MRVLPALALLTLALVASGCLGAEDSPEGSPRFSKSTTWGLEPGSGGEANLRLTEGDEVVATYTSDAGPVRWDVHGHDENGMIRTYDQGSGAEGAISFTAPSDGDFSFYWTNPPSNEAAIVKVTLEGSGVFLEFHP